MEKPPAPHHKISNSARAGVVIVLAVVIGGAAFKYLRNPEPEMDVRIPRSDLPQASEPVKAGGAVVPSSGAKSEVAPEDQKLAKETALAEVCPSAQ